MLHPVSKWLVKFVFELVLTSNIASLFSHPPNAVVSGVRRVHVVWILGDGHTHRILLYWWSLSWRQRKALSLKSYRSHLYYVSVSVGFTPAVNIRIFAVVFGHVVNLPGVVLSELRGVLFSNCRAIRWCLLRNLVRRLGWRSVVSICSHLIVVVSLQVLLFVLFIQQILF